MKNKMNILFFSLFSLCCYGSGQQSTLTTIKLTVAVENASADTTYKWNAYSTSDINLSGASNNSLATNPTILAFMQQQRRTLYRSEFRKIGPGETQKKTTMITISATDTIVTAMLAVNGKEHSFSITRTAGKDSYLKKFIIGRAKK